MTWISKNQQYLSYSEAMSNAQIVITQLINTNNVWSKESLSALVGNMYRESTVNPDLYEMGYDWSADRGYGLCQWTPRSRLSNWADSEGLNYRLGDTQVKRIHYEVVNNIQWLNDTNFYHNPTGHIYSFTEFITNSRGYTLEELTIDFCWHYERPGISYGEESLISKGIPFAKDAFANLDFTGAGTGTTNTKLIIPLKGASEGNITSPYGWRTHPITGESSFHTAIDLANGCEIEVLAALDGVVSEVSNPYPNCLNCGETGYGNYITILHGNGWRTRYAHLVKINVIYGERVEQGKVIGLSGSTGASTGCHLHFELRKEGVTDDMGYDTLDPYPYLFESKPIDLPQPIKTKRINQKEDDFIYVRRKEEE